MGLCKCPKKKVTNLFCFEHRVNVCEHCLVASHTKCIVQSYLQWLQDSDYNPICQLCSKNLSDESRGECIRLTCYDVFHFECLNQFARQLPANTAPAGYCCPTCRAGIFPPHNMASPVADVLRQLLAKVNWARVGLGLPLIQETEPVRAPPPKCSTPTPNGDVSHSDTPHQESFLSQTSPALADHDMSPAPSTNKPSDQLGLSTVAATKTISGPQVHSVISVDTGTSVRGQEKQNLADARRLFDSTKEDIFNISHDHDDDKYKRRPAIDWLNKWLRSRDSNPKRGFKKDPMSVRRKFMIVLLIGIIGFLTMIVIFSKFGRDAAENDPLLDPMANPHVKVNEVPSLLDPMANPHVKVNEVPFLRTVVENHKGNKIN